MAMPTTHDLPTIAGWWGGRDLYWRERLGRFSEGGQRRQAVQQRESEKKALWNAMHAPGCLSDAPANPPTEVPCDAILGFVASAPSPLIVVSLADLFGMRALPTLPGTITITQASTTPEHPEKA